MSDTDTGWNVLIVDDEEDIHLVTKLALKGRTWRDAPIRLHAARSAAEAREMLSAKDAPPYHVALVDVVMETPDAGLELCHYIRKTQPRLLRIVLRTGQAGAAPEDKVLHEYDIDHYMSKPEVTKEKLYATVRACLRASQDIATLAAVSRQLSDFTMVYEQGGRTAELAQKMESTLQFLETKHSVRLAFVGDTSAPEAPTCFGPGWRAGEAMPDPREVVHLVSSATADDYELEGTTPFVIAVTLDGESAAAAPTAKGGMFAKLGRMFGGGSRAPGIRRCGLVGIPRTELDKRSQADFTYDARLFLENYRIGHRTLRMQEALLGEAAGTRMVSGV